MLIRRPGGFSKPAGSFFGWQRYIEILHDTAFAIARIRQMTMKPAKPIQFSMRLTPDEKRKIERLATREGLSAREAILRAVEQVLREDEAQEADDVLALAQSVYDDLDAQTPDAVEEIALDRSRFFGRPAS